VYVPSLHSPVEPAGAWALQVVEIRMPVAISNATTYLMFISRGLLHTPRWPALGDELQYLTHRRRTVIPAPAPGVDAHQPQRHETLLGIPC